MDTTASRTFRLTTHPRQHASSVSRATKRALLLTTLGTASMGIGSVHAIGLDEIAQQSGLGEPLRLVIPLLINASDQLSGDEFAGECFKVIPATANDLPQLNLARTALEHRGGRAFVVVTTAYAISEPIMRVAVQAGCRVSMSREYTLFFDPISIEAPVVAATTAEVAEVEAPANAVAPREPRPVVQSAVAPRKPVAGVARPRAPSESRRATQVVAAPAPATEARVARAANQPRLQVSRMVGVAGATPVGASAATKAAAETEALKALEEETVVLQRRIAELSVTMERMDQELKAARAAKAQAEEEARVAAEQATRAAAQRAAAATPPSTGGLQPWLEANWPLLAAFLGVIALLVGMLVRSRRPVLVQAPLTATQADTFNPMDLGEPSVPGTSLDPEEFTLEPDPDRTQPPAVPRVATPAGISRVVTAATAARVAALPAAERVPTQPAPVVPEFKYDPELLFDYDVEQAAEESSAYSTLEREQPGIVAKLTSAWGTPEAAVRLEHYVLTPHRGGRTLSRNAIAELKLLQAIALERAKGLGDDIVPRAGNGKSWKKVGSDSTFQK